MPQTEHTAILFPGQGSAAPGMREIVDEQRPDLLELATRLVGEDPFARVGQGTRFDQPAIYCASLAAYDALGLPPGELFAGHSLGEVAALAAAGALSETDGLRVVAERGRLMQQAADAVGGGMLALRASRSRAKLIAQASDATVANHNAPDQIVLSGSEKSLAAAEERARELGLRAKRLPVAGAFHSSAMAPAAAPFRALLGQIAFEKPATPVLSCVTARPFDDPRRRLTEALTSPVRWLDVMYALRDAGIQRVIEPGPGRVLSGLVRRSLEDVSIETAEPVGA